MNPASQDQATQQRNPSSPLWQAGADNVTTKQTTSGEDRSQSQDSSTVLVHGQESFSSSSADSLSTPLSSATEFTETPRSDPNTGNDHSNANKALSPSLSTSSISGKPTAKSTSTTPTGSTTDGREPRRCWICLLDETDDNVVDSEWRSPCACALTAHESCLLNWIASIEAPGSRTRPGFATAPTNAFGAAPILCPQCKTEIVVSRPRSYIVNAVIGLRTINRILALPAVALISCATVYQGLFMHGVGTVYTIFGIQEGEALLEPLYAAHHGVHAGRIHTVWDTMKLALQNWRYNLGLPIIPAVLVLSRTKMLDLAMPVVPLIFFIRGQNDQLLDLQWPPTPALTFVLFPYIRSMYNAAYERLWHEREKRWMKELEPQTQSDGNTGNDDPDGNDENRAAAEEEANNNGADDMDEDVGGFQLEVGLEWFGNDDEDIDARAQAPAPDRPAPADAGAEAEAGIPQAQEILLNENFPQAQHHAQDREPRQRAEQAQQQPGHNQANANAIHVNAYDLASTVIGALIFPGIAAVSGEVLRLVLPTSLTSSASSLSSSSSTTSSIFSSTTSSSSSSSSHTSPFSSPFNSLLSSFSSSPDSSKSGLWSSWLGLGIFAPVKSPGLLQQRWGRSVVGGCLFVVLRDALMLYVKWRMARMQRERRVLNYDDRKGGRVKRDRQRNGEGERGNGIRADGSGERRASGSGRVRGDGTNRAGNGSETANIEV